MITFISSQNLAIVVECQESDVKQIREWTGSSAASWMNAESFILDQWSPKQAKACWRGSIYTPASVPCARRAPQAADTELQER